MPLFLKNDKISHSMKKKIDEKLKQEIKAFKEQLIIQREKITNIKELAGGEIDREFSTDLWELSERELDNEMGRRLSFLNDDIDTRPDMGSITSHRKIIGPLVVFFKKILMRVFRMYTHTLLDKQRHFNEQAVAFHLASFIRFRQNEKKINNLEEKLKFLEEDMDLLLEKLDILKIKEEN